MILCICRLLGPGSGGSGAWALPWGLWGCLFAVFAAPRKTTTARAFQPWPRALHLCAKGAVSQQGPNEVIEPPLSQFPMGSGKGPECPNNVQSMVRWPVSRRLPGRKIEQMFVAFDTVWYWDEGVGHHFYRRWRELGPAAYGQTGSVNKIRNCGE